MSESTRWSWSQNQFWYYALLKYYIKLVPIEFSFGSPDWHKGLKLFFVTIGFKIFDFLPSLFINGFASQLKYLYFSKFELFSFEDLFAVIIIWFTLFLFSLYLTDYYRLVLLESVWLRRLEYLCFCIANSWLSRWKSRAFTTYLIIKVRAIIAFVFSISTKIKRSGLTVNPVEDLS